MNNPCVESHSESKIKVHENGRSAVFLNPERMVYLKCRVDGCLIKQETASDFMLTKDGFGDVAIELKGADINKAVYQIFATMKYWKEQGLAQRKMAGLIVCSRVPRFDTGFQRGVSKIAKGFSAPLHITSQNKEHIFDKLLEFK